MGTPDFALVSLDAILHDGRHEVAAVVTQPDRPAGRGGKLQPSPVKVRALELGLPCLQPERIKAAEAVEQLTQYAADIFVVAAYGQILSKEILNMPAFGCVNVHASLLPKYRGAAPIQRAIIDGEAITGVTIMQMDVGLDTGDMLLAKQIEIDAAETSGTLHGKLAALGAQALIEALELISAGCAVKQPQDNSIATYAPMITKSTARINWNVAPANIINQVRGHAPRPCAWTMLDGETIKVYSASACAYGTDVASVPGQVLAADSARGIVVAADSGQETGAVRILELQRQNGKRLAADDFLRGSNLRPGVVFEG